MYVCMYNRISKSTFNSLELNIITIVTNEYEQVNGINEYIYLVEPLIMTHGSVRECRATCMTNNHMPCPTYHGRAQLGRPLC